MLQILTQEQEGWKGGAAKKEDDQAEDDAGGDEGGGEGPHQKHDLQEQRNHHHTPLHHHQPHHPLECTNEENHHTQTMAAAAAAVGDQTANVNGTTQEQGDDDSAGVRQNGETNLEASRGEASEGGAANGAKKSAAEVAIEAILQRDRRVVEEGRDGSMPPELAQEAEWDIHEKPEWVERDVQALREMVEAEPSLNSRLDTPFLLSFLRARKFDYDKAMAMIRSYYKARQENAEMYVNLVPSALEQVWPLKMQTVLPTPDTLGRTVIVFRTGEVCRCCGNSGW